MSLSTDTIEHLSSLIFSSSFVDESDRDYIKSSLLNLGMETDIKDLILSDVDVQLSWNWVLTKYRQKWVALISNRDSHKKELDRLQYEMGVGIRDGSPTKLTDAYVLGKVYSNPEYKSLVSSLDTLQREVDQMAEIIGLFERIYSITQNRSSKIEQLSNNYRLEIKSDISSKS